jgi:putative transcriptional regulator
MASTDFSGLLKALRQKRELRRFQEILYPISLSSGPCPASLVGHIAPLCSAPRSLVTNRSPADLGQSISWKRLTQEQLAREIGVSFSTVNVWENGRQHPQPFLANKIEELARADGLDPEELKDADDQ